MKVAVIGAGPMGLGAAYELLKLDHEVVIFEADDRIGGMTASFDFEGTLIERFYHFHCISDEAFLGMLEELNIQEEMRWSKTKMGYYFNGVLQDWGDPIALLKFRGLSPIAKIRYGLHAFISTKRKNWVDLDKQTAVGWIKKWTGDEAYLKLWAPLFMLKFYELTDQLSAAWIWSRIRRIGRSRYNIFSEKLGVLSSGSHGFLMAMEERLREQGAVIRLNCGADRVCLSNNKVSGIASSSGFEAFDCVISTVPLPYVTKIIPDLSDEFKSKYENIKNVAVVCVIVKLKCRVTDKFWLNINDPEMDIPGIVEYSNLRQMDCHIVYAPFYMPGDNPKFAEPDENFIFKVKHYIKKINTDITDDDILAIKASRYRFAQPVCGPNFLSSLPPMDLPVDGLYVADTSYYYPEDRGISESLEYGALMARTASGL